ncbi:hypothetical protein KPH14_002270 [Odynerus spinipes]|uniref:Uncharacterized protein n=1 Tax=Odynerus spinipes TaxID=1348599 RepID=A0AAD9RL54_9HYME|nr:hypothetical protein KPH14_002270 [Odynerus spinipes]
MISYGRGRSRGSSKELDAPLRRPGGIVSCKNNQSIYNDIIERINNLAINESILADQISEIVSLVDTTKHKETLKSMFDKLYKCALEDKIFGIKLAKLFSNKTFSSIEVDENQNMRYLLLRALQSDYERREEIRKESSILFRNVASLHGELFYHMALVSGLPLKVLQLSLLDYWNMSLETATEEDIELVTTQVIINLQKIYKTHQTEIDQFMLNVRKTLMNNALSVSAKGMLLLIIDLANQPLNSLPANLYDYYTSHLSPTVLIYIQRHEKDLTNAENDDGIKSLQEEGNTKQEAAVKDDTCESRDNAVMNTNKKDCITENIVPRAIRGPGASNTEKNSKNHSKPFTNPPSLKHNSKNKGWGHDDRFDTDYE